MVIFFLVVSTVFNIVSIFILLKVRKINREIQNDLLEQFSLMEKVEKSKFIGEVSSYRGAIKKI